MKDASQSGSAIIWVLIAVILFAAVTTAVMRGSTTSTSLLTNEQAAVYANQIIAYGNDLSAAVQRIKLRGYGPREIGFGNNLYKTQNGNILIADDHNPNCAIDACNVFLPSGGGVQPFITPSAATYLDSSMVLGTRPAPGHWQLLLVSMIDVGTNLADLVMVNVFISEQTCLAINNALGIDNPGGRPPSLESLSGANYTGQDTPVLTPWGIPGKSEFCYTLEGGGEHLFYNYIKVVSAN